MIDVKLDKGAGTVTFAGSGQEITAEIVMVIRELYVQLYRKASPAIAKGCRLVLLNMLAREDSPVWDISMGKDSDMSVFMSGAAAATMMERMRRSEGGSSVTRIDLTKEQCSALAEYLRSLLNNGMGAGCFGKIEMLVLAYRALQAAEEMPEESAPPVPPPKAPRRPRSDADEESASPVSEAAQLKRVTLERLTAYRQKEGLTSLGPLAALCEKVDGKAISAEMLARMLNRERFPVAIWREVAAALDKAERKKEGAKKGEN